MLINSKKYSAAYLRFINVQLNAILNHTEKYYNLKDNPCSKVTKIGTYEERSLKFWTYSEYIVLGESFDKNSMHYLMFELLYWTGMRIGELLALTMDDIDIYARVIRINKT